MQDFAFPTFHWVLKDLIRILETTCPTTLQYSPNELNLQMHCCENLKPHSMIYVNPLVHNNRYNHHKM